MATLPTSAETGPAPRSIETSKLAVKQPAKLKELTSLLETFENFNARVSETTGEDRSGDLGGAGGGTSGSTGQGDQGVSPRDLAIKNLPAPETMRLSLETQIHKEVRTLEREAKDVARSRKPGAAFRLNEVYAHIRSLNALLAQILEASVDVVKRLFIRVFIDRQSIL